MKSYVVDFNNEMTNDSGHNFHCCQRSIQIRAAKSEERAIQAAKRRFERSERIQHWRIHANSFEITEILSAAPRHGGD